MISFDRSKVKQTAPATKVVQLDEATHRMVVELTCAAERFAKRTDSFAEGKSLTCIDLAAKLRKFGSFASEKQREFAAKLVTWSKPREQAAPPATPEAANQQTSAVLAVPNLFAIMQKHSTLHAGKFKISRKNQQSLCWIVSNDVCIGKIEQGNVALFGRRLHASGANQAEIAETLREFNAAPLATARRYGKLSGICCSCGRDLTDPASIADGIGPTCKKRWA